MEQLGQTLASKLFKKLLNESISFWKLLSRVPDWQDIMVQPVHVDGGQYPSPNAADAGHDNDTIADTTADELWESMGVCSKKKSSFDTFKLKIGDVVRCILQQPTDFSALTTQFISKISSDIFNNFDNICNFDKVQSMINEDILRRVETVRNYFRYLATSVAKKGRAINVHTKVCKTAPATSQRT